MNQRPCPAREQLRMQRSAVSVRLILLNPQLSLLPCDPIATRRFDDFIRETKISEAITETQAQIARDAYRDFGRGSGHPAKLNYCFAYALAKESGEPLLFKGG